GAPPGSAPRTEPQAGASGSSLRSCCPSAEVGKGYQAPMGPTSPGGPSPGAAPPSGEEPAGIVTGPARHRRGTGARPEEGVDGPGLLRGSGGKRRVFPRRRELPGGGEDVLVVVAGDSLAARVEGHGDPAPRGGRRPAVDHALRGGEQVQPLPLRL